MSNILHSRFKLSAPAGAVFLTVLLVAGCQNQAQNNASLLAAHDYRYQHPIVVTEAAETLDLPVGRNTRRLNGPITDTIASFAMDSRQRGDGRVEILVPAGAANEAAVHAVTGEIRTALRRGGLGRSQITTRTYSSPDPAADAPIRLSYARMTATAGECGAWPKNIGGGIGPNTNYENFGCATQSNLAAMVENPSDLLAPRARTPADQNRRAVVIEKYRKGDKTAGQYKEGVGAEVAE